MVCFKQQEGVFVDPQQHSLSSRGPVRPPEVGGERGGGGDSDVKSLS